MRFSRTRLPRNSTATLNRNLIVGFVIALMLLSFYAAIPSGKAENGKGVTPGRKSLVRLLGSDLVQGRQGIAKCSTCAPPSPRIMVHGRNGLLSIV
jgi:hypothetical protein